MGCWIFILMVKVDCIILYQLIFEPSPHVVSIKTMYKQTILKLKHRFEFENQRETNPQHQSSNEKQHMEKIGKYIHQRISKQSNTINQIYQSNKATCNSYPKPSSSRLNIFNNQLHQTPTPSIESNIRDETYLLNTTNTERINKVEEK